MTDKQRRVRAFELLDLKATLAKLHERAKQSSQNFIMVQFDLMLRQLTDCTANAALHEAEDAYRAMHEAHPPPKPEKDPTP